MSPITEKMDEGILSAKYYDYQAIKKRIVAETKKKVMEIIDEPIDKNLKMSLDPKMSMIDAILKDRERIKHKLGAM